MPSDIVYKERDNVEFLLQEKWAVITGLLAVHCLYLVGRERKGLLTLFMATDHVPWQIIWAKFLSPTAKIPGDLIDKVTGIRRAITTLTGQRMYFIDRQLKKHGNFYFC